MRQYCGKIYNHHDVCIDRTNCFIIKNINPELEYYKFNKNKFEKLKFRDTVHFSSQAPPTPSFNDPCTIKDTSIFFVRGFLFIIRVVNKGFYSSVFFFVNALPLHC
jgi:hypothetical protein